MPLTFHGPSERLLVAIRGVVFYLWKFIWPACCPHSIRWRDFVAPAGVFHLGGNLRSDHAAGHLAVAAGPALAAGWVAFVVLLVPMLGLVQVGSQVVATGPSIWRW